MAPGNLNLWMSLVFNVFTATLFCLNSAFEVAILEHRLDITGFYVEIEVMGKSKHCYDESVNVIAWNI
jgi:hypothetical protein